MKNYQPSYHLPSFSLNIDYMNENINEILKNLKNDNNRDKKVIKLNDNNNEIFNEEKEKHTSNELSNNLLKNQNVNPNKLQNIQKKNKDTKIDDYLKPKNKSNEDNLMTNFFPKKEIKEKEKIMEDNPINLSSEEIEKIIREEFNLDLSEKSKIEKNNNEKNNININITKGKNNKENQINDENKIINNNLNSSPKKNITLKNNIINNSSFSKKSNSINSFPSLFSDSFPGENYTIANIEEWQKSFPWDKEVSLANLHIFGYNKFRINQREIINANMCNKDIFICMPTGVGKSLTYQIPAIIQNGVTLVFMPLISLIKDQSSYLSCLGINNFFYNDSININYNSLFHPDNIDNMCKIIFITPEKFSKSDQTFNVINQLYKEKLLKRIVIDEAHCVSQWGREFRPDYLNLKILRSNYPDVPILAMTATAPSKIREDVINQLGMKNTIFFHSSYNRPNLFLEVRNKNNYSNVIENIANFITKNYNESCGIIYCSSRKSCEEISKELKNKYNINCDFYHGQMSDKRRNEVQEKWKNDIIKVIVATIAFGMGINKQDVRFIIHYSMPKNFETYYQEIGRAGRDGKYSKCILYYNGGDRKTCEFLLAKTNLNNKEMTENLRKITQICDFCEENFECRRLIALKYFDEKFDRNNCNKMCDNCKKNLKCEIRNCNKEALIILEFLSKFNHSIYNPTIKNMVCHLRNVSQKNDFFKDSSFKGVLDYYNEEDLKKIIRYLIIWGFINEELNITKKNVYSSLKLSEIGFEFLINKNQDINISFRKIDNFSNYEEGLKEEKNKIKERINNKNNINNNEIDNIDIIKKNINIIKGFHSSYHRNYDENNQDKITINNLLNIGLFNDEEDYGLCEPIQFEELLNQLKVLRRDLLKSENEKIKRDSLTGGFKTLFLDDIFPENGLRDLCRKLPTEEYELNNENIFGVNKNILSKFGKFFLPVIKRFINVYNINKEKRLIERNAMNEQINYINNNKICNKEKNDNELLLHMGLNLYEKKEENINKENFDYIGKIDRKETTDNNNIKVEEELKKKANEQKNKKKKKKSFI